MGFLREIPGPVGFSVQQVNRSLDFEKGTALRIKMEGANLLPRIQTLQGYSQVALISPRLSLDGQGVKHLIGIGGGGMGLGEGLQRIPVIAAPQCDLRIENQESRRPIPIGATKGALALRRCLLRTEQLAMMIKGEGVIVGALEAARLGVLERQNRQKQADPDQRMHGRTRKDGPARGK